MFPISVFANIDGVLTQLEVKQADPLHADYEVIKDKRPLGRLNKVNNQWRADTGSNLRPEDIEAIGQAIDSMLDSQNF